MNETIDRVLRVREDLQFRLKQGEAVRRRYGAKWSSEDQASQDGWLEGLAFAEELLQRALEDL